MSRLSRLWKGGEKPRGGKPLVAESLTKRLTAVGRGKQQNLSGSRAEQRGGSVRLSPDAGNCGLFLVK